MAPRGPADGPRVRGARRLLIAGLVFVVLGVALMDVAGRSGSAFWWDVAGACAFIGLLLSVGYLLWTEAPATGPLRWRARRATGDGGTPPRGRRR